MWAARPLSEIGLGLKSDDHSLVKLVQTSDTHVTTIGSSLNSNHRNQVKFVQIPDTLCSLNIVQP